MNKILQDLRNKLIEGTLIYTSNKTLNQNRTVYLFIKAIQLFQTIAIFFSSRVTI